MFQHDQILVFQNDPNLNVFFVGVSKRAMSVNIGKLLEVYGSLGGKPSTGFDIRN